MTSDDFANIALSMPDASESVGARQRDFTISGEIFAKLGYPNEDFALLELTPHERLVVMAALPPIFTRATGEAARSGSTLVRLGRHDAVKDALVRRAMELAYEAARERAASVENLDRRRRN